MMSPRRAALWIIAIATSSLVAGVASLSAQGPALATLPKACWPSSALKGKDTAHLYLPCRDVRVLDPTMRAQLQCTERRMIEHGRWVLADGKPSLRIGETMRSDARQWRLYLQGRPSLPGGRPGMIVTRAKSSLTSAHGGGFAVDVYHARDGYTNRAFYKSLANHAFTCGLEAGYSWTSFPDPPHVQLRTWKKAAAHRAPLAPRAANAQRASLHRSPYANTAFRLTRTAAGSRGVQPSSRVSATGCRVGHAGERTHALVPVDRCAGGVAGAAPGLVHGRAVSGRLVGGDQRLRGTARAAALAGRPASDIGAAAHTIPTSESSIGHRPRLARDAIPIVTP